MDTHLDIVHVKIYAIHLPTPAAAWAGSVCRNYYTGTTKCICAYVHPLLLGTPTPQPRCSSSCLHQPAKENGVGMGRGGESKLCASCSVVLQLRSCAWSGLWLSGFPAPDLLHILLLGCISTPHSTAPESSPSNKVRLQPLCPPASPCHPHPKNTKARRLLAGEGSRNDTPRVFSVGAAGFRHGNRNHAKGGGMGVGGGKK